MIIINILQTCYKCFIKEIIIITVSNVQCVCSVSSSILSFCFSCSTSSLFVILSCLLKNLSFLKLFNISFIVSLGYIQYKF